MSNPILALIPSGTLTQKVYSVLPSDGSGDFAFERNGKGTRVNKDGLIETIGTSVDDLARLDLLNNNCPSLLIEPLRTNRQVRSEELDNASWSKTNTTVTANQTTAPTGELTADKLSRTSTAANYVSGLSSKSASSQLDAVSSVFVKQGQGDFIAFRAAVELHKERGNEKIMKQVYIKAKEQLALPMGQQINVVKEIYSAFKMEEISAKVAELVTPPDCKTDVEVIFQSIEGLHIACPNHSGDWYFSGNYPTPGGNRVVNKSYQYYFEGNNDRAY